MPPFDFLLRRASKDRIEIRRELVRCLRHAHDDPTLSPQVFDAWMARLFPNQRALVRKEVEEMLPVSWPHAVRFPNIIELIQWMRTRSDLDLKNDSPQRNSDAEQVAEGSEEARQETDDNEPREVHDHALVDQLENAVEDVLIQADNQPAQHVGEDRGLAVLLTLVMLVLTLPPLELLRALMVIFAVLCHFSHHQ